MSALGGTLAPLIEAIKAGCDLVLVCNNPDAAAEVLETLQDHHDPVSMARCVRLHGRPALSWDHLRETNRWHNAVRLATDINEAPMDDLDL